MKKPILAALLKRGQKWKETKPVISSEGRSHLLYANESEAEFYNVKEENTALASFLKPV